MSMSQNHILHELLALEVKSSFPLGAMTHPRLSTRWNHWVIKWSLCSVSYVPNIFLMVALLRYFYNDGDRWTFSKFKRKDFQYKCTGCLSHYFEYQQMNVDLCLYNIMQYKQQCIIVRNMLILFLISVWRTKYSSELQTYVRFIEWIMPIARVSDIYVLLLLLLVLLL